jgi:UDP-N-acetylmuramoyl-L-alanyl-D-glutamate--2,6-diaminopimelate ligase
LLLSDLINGDTPSPTGGVDILGIASDSREVRPGYLFAALPGSSLDGRDYIDDAVDHGAVAVLAPPDTTVRRKNVHIVSDTNPRHRLAVVAARFYGAQPDTVAAVTGTNGKTSVANFAAHIWSGIGRAAGCIGTLGLRAPGVSDALFHTTPDPVVLHKALAELAEKGVNHLAIEASSHGLDQCRLDGVRIDVAAFTNLSQDHLDYHGGSGQYFEAKLRLFAEVMASNGTAILHADLPEFETVSTVCRRRGQQVVSYGRKGADLGIQRTRPAGGGQVLEIDIQGVCRELMLPLVGGFQAENALCALGIVMATGADLDAAIDAMSTLTGVPGRLQRVTTHPCGADVYVDYAHTPDALAHVLKALKPYASNRLVVVFGCGGDRDKGKRPIMGEIACQLADRIIVTDDNPRTEDAATIRRQVMAGCDRALEVRDRTEAIRAATAGLDAGDVLVIAGKGHEQGQIIGDAVRPFDDAEAARAAVAEMGGGRS